MLQHIFGFMGDAAVSVPEPASQPPAPPPPDPEPAHAPPPGADQPLIKSVTAFRTALRQVIESNEALLFHNCSRDFKIMIRNDPCDASDTAAIEVGIVSEAATSGPIGLELDGYEVDDAWLLDTTQFPLSTLDSDLETEMGLEDTIKLINELFKWSICQGCHERFVKTKEDDLCLFCKMVARPGGLERRFCAVCQDHGSAVLFYRLQCCHNDLHRRCWKRCAGKCPLCRSLEVSSASSSVSG